MPELSSEEIENLKKYKYKGSDNSLLYLFVLSPLSQAIAEIIPKWVSPNLITLAGLLFSLLSFTLTLLFNPSLGNEGPRWLSLLSAFCLFMYQTLDNVDGKQARRTQTSSPLGMLFDHGCDAMNATISAVPMCSIFGTGRTMAVFLCFSAAYWPFYLQTWEEYHIGEMYLPIVNGPSDGLVWSMVSGVLSFVYGQQFWHTSVDTNGLFVPVIVCMKLLASVLRTNSFLQLPLLVAFLEEELTMFRFFIILIGFAVIATTVAQMLKVIYFMIFEPKPSLFNRSAVMEIYIALLNLLPIIILYPSCIFWWWFSPFAFSNFFVAVVLMGSIFVEIVTHLMIKHICESRTSPLQRYLVWIVFILAANVSSLVVTFNGSVLLQWNDSSNYIDLIMWNLAGFSGGISFGPAVEVIFKEESLVYLFSIFTFIFVFYKMYRICTEAADALGIFVLKLSEGQLQKLNAIDEKKNS